jgi:hypothetical protein
VADPEQVAHVWSHLRQLLVLISAKVEEGQEVMQAFSCKKNPLLHEIHSLDEGP